MGRKPVILCRAEDGTLRAFLNTCRHRETSQAIVLFPNPILVHIQDFINLRQVIPTATHRDRQATYAGRYRDKLVAKDAAWRLQERLAVLKSDLLDNGKITFIL